MYVIDKLWENQTSNKQAQNQNELSVYFKKFYALDPIDAMIKPKLQEAKSRDNIDNPEVHSELNTFQKLVAQKERLYVENILLSSYLKRQEQEKKDLLKKFNENKQEMQEQLNIRQAEISQKDGQINQLLKKIKQLQLNYQKDLKAKEKQNLFETQKERKNIVEMINKNQGVKCQQKDFTFDYVKETIQKFTEINQLTITQFQFEKKLLSQVFDKIIVSQFNNITFDRFISSNFKEQNQPTIFGKIIQKINKEVIENKQINFPSKDQYKKVVEFLKNVDNKINWVILDWNGKLKSSNEEINDEKAENLRLNGRICELQREKENLNATITKLNKEKAEIDRLSKLFEQHKNILMGQWENFIQRTLPQKMKTLSKQMIPKTVLKLQERLRKVNQKENKIKELVKKQKYQIKALQQMIRALEDQIKRLKRKIAQLQNQILRLKDEIERLRRQLEQERNKNGQGSKRVNQLQKMIGSLQKQLQKKQDQIQNKEKQITSITKKYNDQRDQNKKMIIDLDQKGKQIKRLDAIPKFVRCYQQYFNGNLLNYQTVEKTQWFVHLIENYMKKNILTTKYLYRNDPENRNSFHNYIDGYPNIVIIIKHINQQLIGCFSEAAFEKNGNCDQMKGMMAAFTNGNVFYTKRQAMERYNRIIYPKPITWDPDYLIIGNADIRIKPANPKADDLELYSNYGTANSSYEIHGAQSQNGVMELFMDHARTTKYLDYEIYQVIFE